MRSPGDLALWFGFAIVAGGAGLFIGYLAFDWLRQHLRRVSRHRNRAGR